MASGFSDLKILGFRTPLHMLNSAKTYSRLSKRWNSALPFPRIGQHIKFFFFSEIEIWRWRKWRRFWRKSWRGRRGWWWWRQWSFRWRQKRKWWRWLNKRTTLLHRAHLNKHTKERMFNINTSEWSLKRQKWKWWWRWLN